MSGQGSSDGLTQQQRADKPKIQADLTWNALKKTPDYLQFLGAGNTESASNIENVANFKVWSQDYNKGRLDHQTYLDLVKNNPGRESSIIVPSDGTKTVLG